MFSTSFIASVVFSRATPLKSSGIRTYSLSFEDKPYFQFWWEDGQFWFRVTMQYWGYNSPNKEGYNFDYELWGALNRLITDRQPDSPRDEKCYEQILDVLKTLPDGLPF